MLVEFDKLEGSFEVAKKIQRCNGKPEALGDVAEI